MLVVLYGSFGEVFKRSKKHFLDLGFEYISKLSFSETEGVYSGPGGKRELVTREQFYEETDTLFRYEVNGYHVGFNQNQILDSVTNRKDGLLTISTTDIGILSEMKRIYGNTIKIIYCYIDDVTVEKMYNEYDLPLQKRKNRIAMGREIKRCYALNSTVFDYVVIYNGEGTVFNYENLMAQYSNIIQSIKKQKLAEESKSYDICISHVDDGCCYAKKIYDMLSDELSVYPDIELNMSEKESDDLLLKYVGRAKVLIIIVTKNMLQPQSVERVKAVIDAAENGAAIIIPFFVEHVVLESTGLWPLEHLPCVVNYEEENGLGKLKDKLKLLYDGPTTLSFLSSQVDNYCMAEMYEMALRCQYEYVDLCATLNSMSNAIVVDSSVVIKSFARLANILMKLNRWEDALEYIIEAISLNNSEEYTEPGVQMILEDQFVACCQKMSMTVAEVSKYTERWPFEQKMLVEIYENGRDRIVSALDDREETEDSDIKHQIAVYAESIIDVFYSSLKDFLPRKSKVDLITGYERILQFCKYMGIGKDVAAKCVEQVALLRNAEDDDTGICHNNLSEGLKIYLGHALPESGAFDVFISYKSEDKELAEKVYEFLTINGKEVFYAPKSLPQLKSSEYEKAIYGAMEHSKHMVLVGSDPEYFKTEWVSDEWSFFKNEIRKKRKTGNLVIVISDQYITSDEKFPPQLRQTQMIPTSKFRKMLLPYLE